MDSFEVAEGALVVSSRIPCGCDIERVTKVDGIWLPKLLVALAQKDNPFVVSNHISLKNTPYYIQKEKSGSIWHADPDVQKTMRIRGYLFVPGKLKATKRLPVIYTFENGFVPDIKDSNQNREPVNVIAGDDDFSYADSNMNINLLLAPRTQRDLIDALYASICAATFLPFGYDCEHTAGGYGLNDRKKGRFDASYEQVSSAFRSIRHDLEGKLGLQFVENK